MGAVIVFRSLLRNRGNLFQSFLQPLLLLWVLHTSLGANFESGIPSSASLRSYILSFPASEFYAVVVLILTVLVASQYATDLAVQFRGQKSALRPPLQYGSALRAGSRQWCSGS